MSRTFAVAMGQNGHISRSLLLADLVVASSAEDVLLGESVCVDIIVGESTGIVAWGAMAMLLKPGISEGTSSGAYPEKDASKLPYKPLLRILSVAHCGVIQFAGIVVAGKLRACGETALELPPTLTRDVQGSMGLRSEGWPEDMVSVS